MSVINQAQSTTSFVTSLNRLLMYLSFLLCRSRTFCFVMAVSAIRLEMLGLTNNNDILFNLLRKNNVLFDFGSVYVWPRTTASLSPKVSIVGRRYVTLHGRSLTH